jgi:hypothetical protein
MYGTERQKVRKKMIETASQNFCPKYSVSAIKTVSNLITRRSLLGEQDR